LLGVNAVQKVRFHDGIKIDYFTRNDFSSQESWEKFLRYRRVQQLKITSARNQICRKQKKIDNLSCMIQELKVNGEDNAVLYLKV